MASYIDDITERTENLYSTVFSDDGSDASDVYEDHYDTIDYTLMHNKQVDLDDDHYDKIDMTQNIHAPPNSDLDSRVIFTEDGSSDGDNVYDIIDPFHNDRQYIYCNCRVKGNCFLHMPKDKGDHFKKWISWRTQANGQLAFIILHRTGSDVDVDTLHSQRPALQSETLGAVSHYAVSDGVSASSLPSRSYVMYGIPRARLLTA